MKMSEKLKPGTKVLINKGRKKGEFGVIIPDTEKVCCNDTILVELGPLSGGVFDLRDLEVLKRIDWSEVNLRRCMGCIFETASGCGRYKRCRGDLLQRMVGWIPSGVPPRCRKN